MNVAFGDIFNQGRLSVYVTNISEEGVLIQGNNLWVPKEGTSGDSLQYENLAGSLGVELGGWSFGAQFGDLNNDGTQDLFLTNGYVSAAKGTSYWYEFSMVAGGNSSIISDAKNWPPMQGKSLSGYQQKKVWLNDGAGHFTEVAQAVGYTDTHDGRGVALVDLWNRGVLDVLVANQRGPLLVYKNTVPPDRCVGRFRAARDAVQPRRHRCPGPAVLERPGATARGLRRLRLLGPEPASAPLRPGQGPADREGRHPLALRVGSNHRGPGRGAGPPGRGTPMTTTTSNPTLARRRHRPPGDVAS